MGSEILDSKAGGAPGAPASALASLRPSSQLLPADLEIELEPAPHHELPVHERHGSRPRRRPARRPHPPLGRTGGESPERVHLPGIRTPEPTEPPGVLEASLALWQAVGRTVHDPAGRRRALRLVAAGIVLVLVSGVLVHSHDQRVATAARAAELAVDVRLLQLSPDSRPADSSGFTGAGFASSEVLVHNVGPEAVRLLGLQVFVGGGVYGDDAEFPMLRTNTVISATEQLNQSYLVTLPCFVSRSQAGVGEITAQIRTSDGTVHSVPVDLTEIDSAGGLFAACRFFSFSQRQARTQATRSGSGSDQGAGTTASPSSSPSSSTGPDLLGTTLQENQ